jgi:hypothetical protein
MNLPTRTALHLCVIGCAVVTASVRLGHAGAGPDGQKPTAASSAPVAAVVVSSRRVPSLAHGFRHARQGAAARRPARPAAAHATRSRGTARTSAPRQVHRRQHGDIATRAVRRHAEAPRPSYVDGPTSWSALNRAIASIPSYRPGTVRWVISSRDGHWGTADWNSAVIYISPDVPSNYLYDVAVHEWSHELSVLDYDADVNAAVTAMNRYFGGSGLTGAERAADCMAIVQGATWTHYTPCTDANWRAGAVRLIHGERI